MSVREKDDPALYTKIQEQNLVRQYDLLSNCVEIGLKKGIEAFDKYTLWALNYAAVSNICQLGGRYREGPIRVGNHIPPHFHDVPRLMDAFFSVIHENWMIYEHPTMLAAFASLESELDSPLHRGQWKNCQGRLLLPNLHEAGKDSGRQENRTRTHSRKQRRVHCWIALGGSCIRGWPV